MTKRGNPKPWIKKAEQDYEAARSLLRKRKAPLPDIVCFHAQQCAEKYLKAFLILHRVYFPKTHDLIELLNLAEPHRPTLALLKPFLLELRPYAVAFRYPDERATIGEARRAMSCAQRVREQLRQYVKA
jgi:HEPN domain-containing protein